MPDPRFFLTHPPIKISEALQIADAVAKGVFDPARLIIRVASIEDGDLSGAAVYVEDVSKLAHLRGKNFALCFAPNGAGNLIDSGLIATSKAPRSSFAALAAALHSPRLISEHPCAKIFGDAQIHPTAIIGDDAEIGAGSIVGPHVVIGPGVTLGAQTVVSENSTLWCALVGSRCRIGPGAAIGGPGFGFAADKSGLTRVPQLGRVVLDEEIEIGSNVCIDRGAIGDTVIGAGTKIDNLVQIAHNVRIGRNCVIAAQVGIAGSARIGSGVQFGGQAGIADHISIGDDARIAAKAGVMRDIPAGETWGGYPARPKTTWMRETAALARAAGRTKKATSHDD